MDLKYISLFPNETILQWRCPKIPRLFFPLRRRLLDRRRCDRRAKCQRCIRTEDAISTQSRTLPFFKGTIRLRPNVHISAEEATWTCGTERRERKSLSLIYGSSDSGADSETLAITFLTDFLPSRPLSPLLLSCWV